MGKQTIGFSLPERTKPDASAFDTRPSKVVEWLGELPLANVGETTRLVYNTLHSVNRLEIPWQDRLKLLEAFRPTILYIETNLQRRFTGLPFPLPERARQIAALMQSLNDEMALGYKIGLEDMLAASSFNLDKKAMRIMLQRIVCHHSRILLIAYQTYSHYPHGTWLDLHMAYLRGVEEGLHEQVVDEPAQSHSTPSSIEQCYKQILLLSLASPYRLRQGEADTLFLVLRHWSKYATILDYNDPEAGNALFVVHMDNDHEPEYLAYDIRHCEDNRCHYIDTRQLAQTVQRELKHVQQQPAGAPHSGSNLSPDLLKRLNLAWGVVSKRNTQRLEKHEEIEVIVGLTALHEMLVKAHQGESINTQAQFQSKDVDSLDNPRPDVWNLFSPDKLMESIEIKDGLHTHRELEIVVHKWAVQNQSSGGYRLETHEDWANVQVGNLIGLRHNNKQPWEIGVVRWLNQQDGSHLSLGVQLLAPMAYPVMLRNDNSTDDYQRSLLLPGIKAIKQAPSLLTHIRLFRADSDIRLFTSGKELPIRLYQQCQETGSFVQFLFKGVSASTDSPEEQATERAKRFQDIWSQL